MPIQWNDSPPNGDKFNHLPLVRVKPGQPTRGVITTTSIVGVYTHYVGNRTLPHTQLECPGCKAQRRKAWEGYVGIWTVKPSRHIIAVLTAPAANDLIEQAGDPTNLRGLFITLDRINNRPNAKLRATVSEYNTPGLTLPAQPDLRAHLWHIWGLDQSTITEEHPLYLAAAAGAIQQDPHNGT